MMLNSTKKSVTHLNQKNQEVNEVNEVIERYKAAIAVLETEKEKISDEQVFEILDAREAIYQAANFQPYTDIPSAEQSTVLYRKLTRTIKYLDTPLNRLAQSLNLQRFLDKIKA